MNKRNSKIVSIAFCNEGGTISGFLKDLCILLTKILKLLQIEVVRITKN